MNSPALQASLKVRRVPTFRHRGPRAVLLALFLLALAAAHSAPAAADHNFGHATDLGKTTSWESDGKTHVGEAPGADGGESYYRFSVEVAGNVWVHSIDYGFPDLRLFDENRMPLTSWSGGAITVHLEPGTYYVVAKSQSAAAPVAYRLRLVGGGRGHDDVGNVMEAAQLVEPDIRMRRTILRARVDYQEDLDYFKFVVPEGLHNPVHIWSPRYERREPANLVLRLSDEYGMELANGFDTDFFIRRYLAPGTYYLSIHGAIVSGSRRYTGPYQAYLTAAEDDHSDSFQNASRIQLPSETTGTFSSNYSSDVDFFWFRVTTPGSVEIWTSGTDDTHGRLYDSYEVELEEDDDSGDGFNFRINRMLDPGIYYVAVVSLRHESVDRYTLHLSGEAVGAAVTVPLLPSDDAPRGRQGFVRIINHSGKEVEEVKVTAFDDTGREAGSFTLENLGPWQTAHFNSRDLELGNRAKGINSGVGGGEGSWYLEVTPSEPEVEVLSYIRTPDGFLTSMHELVPSRGIEHRVAVFNPGSNRAQASRLRLLHPRCPQSEQSGCSPANVAIFGVDDAGRRSPDVRFQLASGVACEVTAGQLEGLDPSPACLGGSLGGDNSLGDGAGKWQLFISADQHLHVMSLLDGASGHLTNLSAPASSQAFEPPASQSGTVEACRQCRRQGAGAPMGGAL